MNAPATNPPSAPRPWTSRVRYPSLPLTVVCLLLAACFVGAEFAADPNAINPGRSLQGPQRDAWFGTDQLGRDVFSRLLYGGRYTIAIAVGATLLATLLGVIWGAAAAVNDGLVDSLLMRLVDGFMAIPLLLFAMVFASAFGASAVSLLVICGVVHAPPTARLARIAFRTELSADYALAARAVGTSVPALAAREILPNAMPPIAVQATLVAANTILIEATLSFLGLGVQPPDTTWGSLMLEGYRRINSSYWYIVIPGTFVFIAIWCLNSLGDRHSGRAVSVV